MHLPSLDVDAHLQRTSRTFALAIPLLPEPTRRKVGLAYLLFRVADTLEDGDEWTHAMRAQALESFLAALSEPSLAPELAQQWAATPPTTHEGYMSLLNEFPGLLSEVGKLDAASRDVIFLHGRRTAEGMKEILLRGRKQDRLELTGMDDLKHYCYVVAGIVGELLTALFLIDAPALASARSVLEANQVAFGEGLQLVNILKDRLADANSGRSFVPDSIDTADVFALARQDLVCAGVYVDALRADGVPTGFSAFTGLSASLANATLDILEKQGPGAKLSRGEVQRIYANVTPASSQSQVSVDR